MSLRRREWGSGATKGRQLTGKWEEQMLGKQIPPCYGSLSYVKNNILNNLNFLC